MRIIVAALIVLAVTGCRQSGGADFWGAVSKEVGKQEARP